MRIQLLATAAILVAAPSLTACATDNDVLRGAALGTAGGAAVGAVVPGVSTTEGAVAGAAVGAAAGALDDDDDGPQR